MDRAICNRCKRRGHYGRDCDAPPVKTAACRHGEVTAAAARRAVRLPAPLRSQCLRIEGRARLKAPLFTVQTLGCVQTALRAKRNLSVYPT